ncbi:1-aminocyclopropane-1-carboxylate oxidase homolog 1 [Ziziphus jujuba]|uniref:1-aminocyclopropane-1-carboxylate oxidase homolog 1 n=1 Tax=Ziziphus jujuba TaxID=326968 RepID=A0ABM3IEQ4_ZIZJJ|nr:1-aminocyclopropane-1-carboxylate oxidase homolog 1 [Ziziphus jujuba]
MDPTEIIQRDKEVEQFPPKQKQCQRTVIPVIDLRDETIRRKEIVKATENAAANWDFYQIINHGIPLSVIEEMVEAARRFQKQPQEVKEEWYSLDFAHSNVNFVSNPRFKADAPGDWRNEIVEYYKGSIRIRKIVAELLSESWGLNSSGYIRNMGLLKLYDIDVKPVKGASTVNIGDMMQQLVSNDKFKSVEHGVLATQGAEPRVSVTCFLTPDEKH